MYIPSTGTGNHPRTTSGSDTASIAGSENNNDSTSSDTDRYREINAWEEFLFYF